MRQNGLLIVVMFGAVAVQAAGQDRVAVDPTDPVRVTVYWENDGGPVGSFNNTDRHYTNGLALGVTHQPAWAKDVAKVIPFDTEFGADEYGMGYITGQLMFTPADLKQTQPITDDRPYAGYLYAGAYFQRANDHTLDHFELDVGMTGPSTHADDLQRQTHDLVGGVEPRGWDNQLHDEVTFNFTLRKTWKLPLIEPGADGFTVELLPELVGRVGTVWRDFEFGGTLRFGINLPDDFGPPRIARPADAVGDGPRGWSLYGFGRAAGRAAEHNLFIEGNNFRESLGVQAEPFVGEFTVGAALGCHWTRWSVDVTYSYTMRTDEFEDQADSDAFASLVLSATYWFD